MAKARLWIIGALLIPVTGCAVNGKGFVNVHYFENESSYLVTQESWGGYLSTRQTDGGLTLGHAKRTLIYPKPGNNSSLSINELLHQSAGSDFDKEIEAKDVDLKDLQPYAWIEKNQGVTLHANPIKTGFSVGMESSNAIRLPSDFDGILMFNYREDGTVEAVIHETKNQRGGK
jgi:hypothetical protein